MNRYRQNLRDLQRAQQRFPRSAAYRVSGIDEACEGPHYDLEMWARSAIHDRVYSAKSEPVYHWRFNVIGRERTTVVVTPLYEPFDVEKELSMMTCWTRQDVIEHQQAFHGESNWRATMHFLIRVIGERSSMNGYLEAFDHAYVHLQDTGTAQAVLDTLWAAIHGDERVYKGATHCAFCQHRLTDTLSSMRGYGPDCAERYGVRKRT